MIAPGNEPPLDSDADEGVFHVSPDGLLALCMVRDVDGEWLLGFHGHDWNIQVSVLSELTGLSPEEATRQFVDDVLQDRAIIAILKSHGEIADVWVTESPKIDLQYVKEGESLSFRYWSGAVARMA